MTVQSKTIPVNQVSLSFPSSLLTFYLAQLNSHPLRTKAITSGVLSASQEYVVQLLTEKNSRRKGKARESDRNSILDNKIVKMGGPLGHVLFESLNRLFKNRTGASSKLLQIIASQLIITPIHNIVFLTAMALINGIRDPEEIKAFVKKSLWPIMKMSWVVSPLAMIFAQRVLPPQIWVPFFNLVGSAKKAQQLKERDSDHDED
ncbi:3375_t:CDS:2 [Diversispora eburnea]|uniref:3375_t:CDS:1 n=1 Tax=Diversispora eburnea TaxID=1213867 RepID=A0A9N8WPH7_9GLOM|nr:3375_t:CDS:2 [Diversispora eburnea]